MFLLLQQGHANAPFTAWNMRPIISRYLIMTYNSSVELDFYRQIYLKCNIRVQNITSVWKHSLDVSLQPLFSILCQFQQVVHMHRPTFYMHLFIRIDLRSSWKFTWNKSSPHTKSGSGIVFLCPLISEYLRNFVIHLNHKAKKKMTTQRAQACANVLFISWFKRCRARRNVKQSKQGRSQLFLTFLDPGDLEYPTI